MDRYWSYAWYRESSIDSKDIHQRLQNLRHLYLDMGLKLGVFGFFLQSKQPWLVRCVCHCISCDLSVKINNTSWHTKIVNALVYRCFCVCGLQKPEDPQIGPHCWRHHYTGRCRRSGISDVYLWLIHICFISKVVMHKRFKPGLTLDLA